MSEGRDAALITAGKFILPACFSPRSVWLGGNRLVFLPRGLEAQI